MIPSTKFFVIRISNVISIANGILIIIITKNFVIGIIEKSLKRKVAKMKMRTFTRIFLYTNPGSLRIKGIIESSEIMYYYSQTASYWYHRKILESSFS